MKKRKGPKYYYCHKCQKKVLPQKGAPIHLKRCRICEKVLWDAHAEHNDNKLRTTKQTYVVPEIRNDDPILPPPEK